MALRRWAEKRELETPLVGNGFEARKLPKRRALTLEHDWAVGARLGPLANWFPSAAPPYAPAGA